MVVIAFDRTGYVTAHSRRSVFLRLNDLDMKGCVLRRKKQFRDAIIASHFANESFVLLRWNGERRNVDDVQPLDIRAMP